MDESDSFKTAQALLADTVAALQANAPTEPEPPAGEADTSAELSAQPAPEPEGGPIPPAQEPPAAPQMVPLDRYENAVKAMTQAKMEAAELRRTVAALEQRTNELAAQLTERPDKPAGNDDSAASLDSVLEEYPDIVGPLVRALEKANQRLSALEGRAGERPATPTAPAPDTSQDGDLAAYWQQILAVHPDALALPSDPGFIQWAGTQAPTDQAILGGGGTASQLIDLLHRYYDSRAKAPPPAPAAHGKGNGHAKPTAEQRLQAASKAASPSFGKPPNRQPASSNGLDTLLNRRVDGLTSDDAWNTANALLQEAHQQLVSGQ